MEAHSRFSHVIHTLTTNPNFNFKHIVKWSPQFMGMLAFMFYLMTPSLPFELFQRMAMAKDIGQAKRYIAYAISSLLIALFRFKQANKNLMYKHAYLYSTHQKTTQNLLKARRYEEKFVKALNTEGAEEFNKVVSLSKELEV